MRRAIAAFAREGNNVIIDDLMFEPGFLFDYVEALKEFDKLFVGVRCPIDVVNAREAKRPGRFPGTATSHFDQVHRECVYDIEVDTGSAKPPECAELIIARLNAAPRADAFRSTSSQRWVGSVRVDVLMFSSGRTPVGSTTVAP